MTESVEESAPITREPAPEPDPEPPAIEGEVEVEHEDDEELEDEPEPPPARRVVALVEEPEVEQELPPRPEPRPTSTPNVTLASESEALMDRGAPFSPEEMRLLHDFVTEVRGAGYWDAFKNRPDVSVLRHAEGALRHYQMVILRKK